MSAFLDRLSASARPGNYTAEQLLRSRRWWRWVIMLEIALVLAAIALTERILR
jgi:hypothetical protein